MWGDGLCYIIVKAKVEVVLVSVQHAADNVSHWPGLKNAGTRKLSVGSIWARFGSEEVVAGWGVGRFFWFQEWEREGE